MALSTSALLNIYYVFTVMGIYNIIQPNYHSFFLSKVVRVEKALSWYIPNKVIFVILYLAE